LRDQWPQRQSLTPGTRNVIRKPLIKPYEVFPPALYIKLGIMKNFVMALDMKVPAIK